MFVLMIIAQWTPIYISHPGRGSKAPNAIAIGCVLLTLSLSGCERKQRTPTPKVVNADFMSALTALRQDAGSSLHSGLRIADAVVERPSGH